ncbi:MAG: hypothetical protein AB4372_11810 [Xenococcus sp. (in: cyanobacteria)]
MGGKIIDLRFSIQRSETYLIAIAEDPQGIINLQYWNITQKLNLENLIQQACRRLDQNSLTQEETKRFVNLCPE